MLAGLGGGRTYSIQLPPPSERVRSVTGVCADKKIGAIRLFPNKKKQIKMNGIFFLIMALFCHNPKHTKATSHCPLIHVSTVNTLDDGSDDTGNVPPKPPVPPTPPTNP